MRPKLVMCQGLPASGKTTWALEQAASNPDVVVVSKDDIRLWLETQTPGGWTWSPENENLDVLPERDRQVEEGLKKGLTVISSDTNFGSKHETQLRKLARRHQASFEIKRFDTPLKDCLERNSKRTAGKVPSNVIYGMFEKNVKGKHLEFPLSAGSEFQDKQTVKPVKYDPTLMPAIICDLDGTLALHEGRRNIYDASTADQDALNWPVFQIIRTFHNHEHWQIIYLSGREEKYRLPTEAFLRNNHCPPGPLFMRQTGDTRKDCIIKSELFDAHVRDRYNVQFCLDDRNQVVKFWRSLGLTCLQVAEGDF